jgi:hypothetical protein
MDTTQSFGISAGAKTQSISGSMMFPTTLYQTGTVANNNYLIFHIAGSGDNVSSLTGVPINDALSGGFIAKGGEVMEYFCLDYGTSLSTSKDVELYCIISSKATYEGALAVNYTATLIKSGLTTSGVAGRFTFASDSIPSITLNEGDLVNFAIKNVSGGSFVGLHSLLTIYFNSTL